MPSFAFVYSHRSRLPVIVIHSFCHYIIPLFVLQSFVCYIEPLGSDTNKIDSDCDSDSPPVVAYHLRLSPRKSIYCLYASVDRHVIRCLTPFRCRCGIHRRSCRHINGRKYMNEKCMGTWAGCLRGGAYFLHCSVYA